MNCENTQSARTHPCQRHRHTVLCTLPQTRHEVQMLFSWLGRSELPKVRGNTHSMMNFFGKDDYSAYYLDPMVYIKDNHLLTWCLTSSYNNINWNYSMWTNMRKLTSNKPALSFNSLAPMLTFRGNFFLYCSTWTKELITPWITFWFGSSPQRSLEENNLY